MSLDLSGEAFVDVASCQPTPKSPYRHATNYADYCWPMFLARSTPNMADVA